jgi:hypothetical protein
MRPDAKRSGPPAAMGRPKVSPPGSTTSMVADPGDCGCGCGCCQQLLRALSGIRVELSKIRERLDGVESERAGWPS